MNACRAIWGLVTGLFLFLASTPCRAAHHVCTTETSVVDGETTVTLSGGDTLFLQAGERDYLLIKNLHGTPDHPIVIINQGGAVRLITDHYYGLSFRRCSFIKLTGTGSEIDEYGIRILRSGGDGIGIGDGSTDFEVEAVEIAHTASSGISAKTDPDCSLRFTRGNFVMTHIEIHDNYFHDIGTEGLYIGNTFWFGRKIVCDGQTRTVYPHYLRHVHIHNNRLERIGWDSIQVNGVIEDCVVRDNAISHDSYKACRNQMSGIMIGAGTVAEVYNNRIFDGKGSGIEFYGPGGQKIYNNLIVNSGLGCDPLNPERRCYGIYLADRDTRPGGSFFIYHNTIVNPKTDGIRFSSVLSRNSKIFNNLIVNPGAFDFYESGNTAFRGIDAFVMLTQPGIDVLLSNNLFVRAIEEVGFVDAVGYDFRLTLTSPAIDQGRDDTGILFDIDYGARSAGAHPDIGAFEWQGSAAAIDAGSGEQNSPDAQGSVRLDPLHPNPVRRGTAVSFSLATGQSVDLILCNVLGRQIRTLMESRFLPAGFHRIDWQSCAQELQSGTYWLVLRSGSGVTSRRFCVVH